MFFFHYTYIHMRNSSIGETPLYTKFYESVILRNVPKLPNFSCGNISVWKVGVDKHKL